MNVDEQAEDDRMARAGLTVEQRLQVARVHEQNEGVRASLGRLAEAMAGHRERNPEQYAPGARPERFRQQRAEIER